MLQNCNFSFTYFEIPSLLLVCTSFSCSSLPLLISMISFTCSFCFLCIQVVWRLLLYSCKSFTINVSVVLLSILCLLSCPVCKSVSLSLSLFKLSKGLVCALWFLYWMLYSEWLFCQIITFHLVLLIAVNLTIMTKIISNLVLHPISHPHVH